VPSEDRPTPRPQPEPGDPGKFPTEPQVRAPGLPWQSETGDPGRLRSERIPLSEDRPSIKVTREVGPPAED